jgi:hypothetical protein
MAKGEIVVLSKESFSASVAINFATDSYFPLVRIDLFLVINSKMSGSNTLSNNPSEATKTKSPSFFDLALVLMLNDPTKNMNNY